VNPTLYRVLNFILLHRFAGWLGGIYAHYFGLLTPKTVTVTLKTVEVWNHVGRIQNDTQSDNGLAGPAYR
jgi:ABC-type branched-subunit amino acid transport system permease subunit